MVPGADKGLEKFAAFWKIKKEDRWKGNLTLDETSQELLCLIRGKYGRIHLPLAKVNKKPAERHQIRALREKHQQGAGPE